MDVTVAGGLQAATFRTVAQRAGVSVRLVQYYFGDKDRLLAETLTGVGSRAAGRVARALEEVDAGSPHQVLMTVCEQFLPLDDERRREMLVFIAFRTAALTDPGLASSQQLGLAGSLISTVQEQLRAAAPDRSDDELRRDAVLLVAELTGLANMVLAGEISSSGAHEHLRYAVGRVTR